MVSSEQSSSGYGGRAANVGGGEERFPRREGCCLSLASASASARPPTASRRIYTRTARFRIASNAIRSQPSTAAEACLPQGRGGQAGRQLPSPQDLICEKPGLLDGLPRRQSRLRGSAENGDRTTARAGERISSRHRDDTDTNEARRARSNNRAGNRGANALELGAVRSRGDRRAPAIARSDTVPMEPEPRAATGSIGAARKPPVRIGKAAYLRVQEIDRNRAGISESTFSRRHPKTAPATSDGGLREEVRSTVGECRSPCRLTGRSINRGDASVSPKRTRRTGSKTRAQREFNERRRHRHHERARSVVRSSRRWFPSKPALEHGLVRKWVSTGRLLTAAVFSRARAGGANTTTSFFETGCGDVDITEDDIVAVNSGAFRAKRTATPELRAYGENRHVQPTAVSASRAGPSSHPITAGSAAMRASVNSRPRCPMGGSRRIREKPFAPTLRHRIFYTTKLPIR